MSRGVEIQKSIVLDTHIWIWLLSGAEKTLSPRLRKLIDQCAENDAVYISAISAWEVGMLVSKKRISFTCDAKEWIYKALRAPGIVAAPVTPEIAIESTLLLEDFHGDPADRIILATARHLNATLITHDKEILAYCHRHRWSAVSL